MIDNTQKVVEYLGPSDTYVQIVITGIDEEAVESTAKLIELDEDLFLKTT